VDRTDTARHDLAEDVTGQLSDGGPLVGDARVWAIVLTHGGAEAVTAACIDSLLEQDYGNLVVLLVDNASFDGSGERLRDRYPRIRYLNTGANLGYTGGNNRGIRYALDAGADYVMILNNDTVLDARCVSTLVRSAPGAERLGAIAPKILYWDEPTRIWFAGGDFSLVRAIGLHRGDWDRDDPNERERLDAMTFATGCCFLMPAAVARETGGFREDYFIYCEDVELSLRLVRSGYRLYYQPAARLFHREPPHRGLSSPFATVHRDRNRRRLVREHYSAPQRVAFALWFYPTRLVRLAQYALRGDWAGARATIAGAVVQ
jgi:GT2 family glycosyltransferase